MTITDIKVRKLFDDGPMKAIVSVTFDGQLVLADFRGLLEEEVLKAYEAEAARAAAEEEAEALEGSASDPA